MSIAANLASVVESAPPIASPRNGRDVDALMTYLADASVRPVTYNPPPGTGLPRRIGNYGSFRVRIRDARPIAGMLDLDRHGFALTRHDSAVRDFYDEREVREVYYEEVADLVKAMTG